MHERDIVSGIRTFRRSVSSSTVTLLRFTLIRSGTTMILIGPTHSHTNCKSLYDESAYVCACAYVCIIRHAVCVYMRLCVMCMCRFMCVCAGTPGFVRFLT
jgi:hypothetical protein